MPFLRNLIARRDNLIGKKSRRPKTTVKSNGIFTVYNYWIGVREQNLVEL